MKLKDFVNISKNRTNNQDVLTLRKKELKKIGLSKSQLLNMNVKKEKW